MYNNKQLLDDAEQNIVICMWLRQIIDLRDTDKSRYFTITEFNNCFIIRSPSLFPYLNHSLTAQGSHTREWLHLYATTHEQTIICRQLFAGHVVGSRAMKRKKTLYRTIIVNDS